MTKQMNQPPHEIIQHNPWTPQDEGDHYPTMREWWCIETLFTTAKDHHKWSLKVSLAYERETPSCFFIYHLFDTTSNRCVCRKAINDDIKELSHVKNRMDLRYKKTTMKGLFPNYQFHIEDDEQAFCADMNYTARIPPHWSAQDATNGYLPIGLDYYRYGWLLNCDLTGTLTLGDITQTISGKGYLERAWGNWSYANPFQKLSGLRKTLSTYGHLFSWWFQQNTLSLPKRLSFTTENNPFGYDWFWGVADNNWSVFYGNSLFWVREGPAFGVLTACTDKGEFMDFGNIHFQYNKTIYNETYDMEYPIDMTLKARLNDKRLILRVWPVCDGYEYIDDFPGKGFYKAFIMPEIPGHMKGTYWDKTTTVNLEGDCKIVQQRQPSQLGHNSLTIDVTKPPQGLGLNCVLDSHFLRKKVTAGLQLSPSLKLRMGSINLPDSHAPPGTRKKKE
jgi:hypothetical protein